MKRIHISFLLLSLLLISGCASSDATSEQEEKTEPEVSEVSESAEDEEEAQSENVEPETHLELTGLENYAPYYTLRFQKIEGGTGKVSGFAYTPDPEDPSIVTAPEHVEVIPSEKLGLLTCSFSGDENPEDEVTLSLWNRGEEENFQIVLDDLEYEVSLPEETSEETELNQKLENEGPQAMLDKAVVYPHTILLELSGIDSAHWDCGFWLVNADTQEIVSSPMIFYDEDLEELSLLCVFEDEIPDVDLALRISESHKESAADDAYHDYQIKF